MTQQEIVDTARLALGTPWVHQGRTVPVGIDCAGLVIWTGKKLGMLPASYMSPPYTRTTQWNRFLLQFRENMDEIAIDDARPGDTLIFRQQIYPCHCGLMTEVGDQPRFIHAYVIRGKVVEEYYTPMWRNLTRAVFRYREATNG